MRKVIVYCIFLPFFLSGQDSIPAKKSDNTANFYLSVFDVIDKYEKNCRFSKLSRYNDFENLFTDSSSSIYNDIIPSSSFMKNVSPRQYISEVRRLERKRLAVDIDVLEVGDVYSKSTNSGMIDVYVSKYMKAMFDDDAANIIHNNIKEFIDWEHTIKLKIQIVYQNYRDTINGKPQFGRVLRINSIKKEDSKQNERFNIYVPFEKNLFTKERVFASDTITIHGEDYPLKGKSINYFISKNLQKGDEIKLKGFEGEYKFTRIKPLNDGDLMKKVMFRKKIPLQLSYNLSLNPSVDIGSLNDNLTIKSVIYDEKLSASISLYPIYFDDFETSLPFFQLFINTQVGVEVNYSISEINFQDGTFTSVNADAVDADNGTYQRTHTISNIQETVSLTQTHIFLSFRKKWSKIKFMPEKLEAGLVINPLLYSYTTSTFEGSADANYSGYYEDLFGLVIGDDEQWEHYNLGSYSLDNPEAVEINSGLFKPFILELGGFLEYPFKIKNLSTGVNLGVNYIINTQPLAEATENEISTNSQEYKSIVSNTEYLKINDGVQISIGGFIKF